MKIKDVVKGKKVLFYGDSITHNWNKYDHDLLLLNPDDSVRDQWSYVFTIEEEGKTSKITNKAVSGGCYANLNTKARPVWRHFPYQVENSIEDLKEADVIFVEFGSNDFSDQNPFGSEFEKANSVMEANTFFKGMNYGFDLIKKYNPKAKVFVINCLFRTLSVDPGFTYNYSLTEYNLAIAYNVRRYGFTLVDVSHLFSIKDFNPEVKPSFTNDGLHPNNEGHKRLGEYILNMEI